VLGKNINDVVRNALLYAGCHPSLIEDIDQYSTIKIDLRETSSIYIGKCEDAVVIWSDICDFYESIIRHLTEQKLEEVIGNFSYGIDEQLMLRESERKLQLYVELKNAILDEPKIVAEMINSFFERQSKLVNIIRQ